MDRDVSYMGWIGVPEIFTQMQRINPLPAKIGILVLQIQNFWIWTWQHVYSEFPGFANRNFRVHIEQTKQLNKVQVNEYKIKPQMLKRLSEASWVNTLQTE